MNRTLHILAGGLLACTFASSAIAQSTDAKPAQTTPAETSSPETHPRSWTCNAQRNPNNDCVLKTYFLNNTYEQNDANEILIAMRNMLDSSNKLYLVASRRAIEFYGPPDQQVIAEKIISELDRPHKTYRLTFTLAESDSGKRIGIQHFAMVVAAGQRTVLKQGDKVPVATGSYEPKNDTGTQTQFQYLDIGINIDATLTDSSDGLLLKSKVEESSLGQPTTIAGVQEPVIRQTSLEGTSAMRPGKPLTLGSIDIKDTTRHVDVEVVAEPIP